MPGVAGRLGWLYQQAFTECLAIRFTTEGKMLNFDCGIYSITTPDGKEYIGQAQSFAVRWSTHLAKLRAGKGDPGLREAFNKFGEAALIFRKIAIVSVDDLSAREQEQIDARSPESLHNVVRKATCGNRGVTLSAEARENMSASAKVKAASDVHRERFLRACVKKSPRIAPKPIVCVEMGVKFESLSAATDWLRANGYPRASQGNISSACTGRFNKSYGYTWRYADAIWQV